MTRCDGCYYEDRPPQEACNLCHRDQDGHLTGYIRRDQMDETTLSVSCADSSPTRGRRGDCRAGTELPATEVLLRQKVDEMHKEIQVLQKQCKELQTQLEESRQEADSLRERLNWECRESDVLEAKLEMVHLIFGKEL